MAVVYILYSRKIDKFYVGSCLDFEKRLNEHNSHFFKRAYTTRASDWIIFYKYENLELELARKIEFHIKKMKSKVYNENLLKYDEIMNKLIDKYSAGSYR